MPSMEDSVEKWVSAESVLPGYEVSTRGRVRSVDRVIKTSKEYSRRTGQLISPVTDKDGYKYFTVRRKSWKVHRVICETFHGPPPSRLHVVRHLNGNPSDNRPDNLKWGTRKENAQDLKDHGRDFNLKKTECPQGHPYEGDNLYITKGGGRACRECGRKYALAYYYRKKEKNVSLD